MKEFEEYACQYCGSKTKLVETIIDDEFCWDEISKSYEPNKFSDDFEHTGNNRCAECDSEWTGL